MKTIKIVFLTPLLLLSLLFASGCQNNSQVVITTQSGSKVAFQVEIADTPASQEQGLQYRKSLAQDKGMLFVFSEEQMLTFWMKNTFIPLDMIFINADLKIVGIAANTTPFSLAPMGVSSLSKYVLEINGGVAQSAGIHTGDSVVIPAFSDVIPAKAGIQANLKK